MQQTPTPFEVVLLLVVASFSLALLATLLPMFTSWHIPGILGVFELIRGIAPAFHAHAAHRWFHLIAGVILICFAALVETSARMLGRLVTRLRARSQPQTMRRDRVAEWLQRHFSLRLSKHVDAFVTFAQVSLILTLVAMLPLTAAAYLGRWLGGLSAQPDQAIIVGGHTYVWLGTTDAGLVVGRQADFCGAGTVENARQLVLSGERSQLLDVDGATVIRLASKLRVVDRCKNR